MIQLSPMEDFMPDKPILDKKVSTRFDTPILDTLREKQRNFVMSYCMCFDVTVAAKMAGYRNEVPAARKQKEKDLISDPTIVAAIDEYSEQMEKQLGKGKIAMCRTMFAVATASIYDICDRVPFKNASGKSVEGRWMFQPKDLENIGPQFIGAASLMVLRRDGAWGFDNATKIKTQVALSKLMMWDQGSVDDASPITFNFGINIEEYKRPEQGSGGADMSAFKKDDEIDDLIKE